MIAQKTKVFDQSHIWFYLPRTLAIEWLWRGQMRMWHQGWQPVWGRPHLLDRSWEWYLQNLESSQREAQRQVNNRLNELDLDLAS